MKFSHETMSRTDEIDLIVEQVRSRRPTRLIILALLIALVVGFAAIMLLLTNSAFAQSKGGDDPPPQGDGACTLAWQIVPSANTGDESLLQEVDVVSASNIWAVGYYYNGATPRTLIEHWNGTSWSIVSSPNNGTGGNYLQSIDVISANDIWAVGYYSQGATARTLILHYNGTSWSLVTSPNQGSDNNFLQDVEAVSASNVWAVGYYLNGAVERTLTLRYNGTSWSVVSSPNEGSNINKLESLSVVTSSDIWAVGYYWNGSVYRNLTLHWNGTVWSSTTNTNQGSVGNFLYAVDAVSATNVWAVGAYGSIGNYQTLIMRYNGTSWSIIASPNVGSSPNVLLGLKAISSSDIWAVGFYVPSGSDENTLTMRYNGSSWSIVNSPNTTREENRLNGIASVSSGDVWAAGYSEDVDYYTLIEHYACEPCTIAFTDVPEGSTFYDYVRCMACQDIITGYTSGCETGNPCFRPNNNVTRGQLAKIVSNSAGFNEAVGAQQYQDITPGSTFYDFVWRLSNRGIIGGYPCGGPGEPCIAPNNRPYFRPNANASRGQISKIVSEAAGLNGAPGAQQFEDVPPATTFYDYVQRLANLGAMQGYPCGGPGEPCIGPGNRPYFRPGSNATRGQTSKIVATTFFPSCPVR